MWLLLFLMVALAAAQQWDASKYPNPRKGGFKQCNMKSASSVCDPDEVLSMESRYRLNNDLQRISVRTERAGGAFCDRKGTDAILAIVRQGSQQLVNDLSRLWHMDDQCKKGIIFLLSSDDHADEVQSIIDTNERQLQTGDFVGALGNIFKEVGKRTNIEDGLVTPHPPISVAALTIYSSLPLLLLFNIFV
ncbi:unnamed protein product [Haemonchus placei]|uniref:TPM_phosphatase domain-containing protein n=1 Tax=Haemonchus placei TaxID=6290 RepID=A0A0N4W597_HAEPC|nr:unnamed protein product [Haemonchus placei]